MRKHRLFGSRYWSALLPSTVTLCALSACSGSTDTATTSMAPATTVLATTTTLRTVAGQSFDAFSADRGVDLSLGSVTNSCGTTGVAITASYIELFTLVYDSWQAQAITPASDDQLPITKGGLINSSLSGGKWFVVFARDLEGISSEGSGAILGQTDLETCEWKWIPIYDGESTTNEITDLAWSEDGSSLSARGWGSSGARTDGALTYDDASNTFLFTPTPSR